MKVVELSIAVWQLDGESVSHPGPVSGVTVGPGETQNITTRATATGERRFVNTISSWRLNADASAGMTEVQGTDPHCWYPGCRLIPVVAELSVAPNHPQE